MKEETIKVDSGKVSVIRIQVDNHVEVMIRINKALLEEKIVTLKASGTFTGKKKPRPESSTAEQRGQNFLEAVWKAGHKKYLPGMLVEFCSYWTEKSEKGSKMRFEKQKAFDIPKRLYRWAHNQVKVFAKEGPADVYVENRYLMLADRMNYAENEVAKEEAEARIKRLMEITEDYEYFLSKYNDIR